MELDHIHLTPTINGFSFSIEEKVLLQASLPLLKQDYKLWSVLVWGKILGTQKDYILAQGQVKNDADYGSSMFFFRYFTH